MITVNDLKNFNSMQSELLNISKRIDLLQDAIAKEEEGKVTDIVHGSSSNFPYVTHNIHIEGLKNTKAMLLNAQYNRELESLEKTYDELLVKIEEIQLFVDECPDSYIRQIVRLRYIECHTWQQVSQKMGGINHPNGLRQMLYRYLEKHEKDR